MISFYSCHCYCRRKAYELLLCRHYHRLLHHFRCTTVEHSVASVALILVYYYYKMFAVAAAAVDDDDTLVPNVVAVDSSVVVDFVDLSNDLLDFVVLLCYRYYCNCPDCNI